MLSLTTILLFILVLLLLAFVIWNQAREKHTKIRSIWIQLLLIGVLGVLSFSNTLIHSTTNIALLIGCGLVGLIIGIVSGRLVKLQVDMANDTLIVQGTTWSIVIWVVLFIIKQVFHVLSKQEATGVLIDLIGSNILFLTACSALGMHLYRFWYYSQQRRASTRTQ